MCHVWNKSTHAVPPTAVYVGRPSPFGNPFVIGRDGSREEVVRKYEAWLMAQPDLVARAKEELVGRDLVCWCAPRACHADILMRIANGLELPGCEGTGYTMDDAVSYAKWVEQDKLRTVTDGRKCVEQD